MNIDFNSRIKWHAGMVLTADTFGTLDDNIDMRQRLALRVGCRQRFGLVPDMPFAAQGLFVQGRFEIMRLECTALLPTGAIISIDEPVSIPFVRKGDGYNYLCVGIGSESVEYERNNVPHTRPKYEYTIKTLAEIELERDVLPLVRFSITDGAIRVDDGYIVPSLTCNTPLIQAAIARVTDVLTQVVEHKNLKEGDGHQMLLWQLFRLRSFGAGDTVQSLVHQTESLVQAIYYFITSPTARQDRHTAPTETAKLQHRMDNPKAPVTAVLEHPDISYVDIQLWLTWCEDYIAKAKKVLDEVELVDESINLDVLKQEIKDDLYSELYDRLKAELTADLTQSLCQRIGSELEAHIDQLLRQYTDGTVRQQLHDGLHTELRPDLYDALYRSLYQALYDALQTPEPVEEHLYTPLI